MPASSIETPHLCSNAQPPSSDLSHAQLLAKVQACRRQQGLTQAALARQLGISVRTYQEWEQGRRRPSGAAITLLRGYVLSQ